MEMINKVCKVMINDQVLAIRMVKEMFTYPLIEDLEEEDALEI